MPTNLTPNYGPISTSDNAFTRKARHSQSWYRLHKLEEQDYGAGPNKTSTTKYGNVLANGNETGKNFILKETFKYAKERIRNKQLYETIDEYRLFNNMLSSMPMCFNLFHPLMLMLQTETEAVDEIFKSLFPLLNINSIKEIKIEFVPNPITEYLKDKSAMDAAIIYTNNKGEKGIITVETKYVEKLGVNPPSDATEHIAFAKKSGFFTAAGLNQISENCSQIFRNFLLTEKYKEVKKIEEACTVVLSPKDNPYTKKEVNTFIETILPQFHYKVIHFTLEQFVETIKNRCPPNFKDWIEKFEERYIVYYQ